MKSEVLNQTKNKPLKVGDVVIVPKSSDSSYKEIRCEVTFVDTDRNWCRLRTHGLTKGEGKIAISLSRANELERCSK